jgi:hypothetical protein
MMNGDGAWGDVRIGIVRKRIIDVVVKRFHPERGSSSSFSQNSFGSFGTIASRPRIVQTHYDNEDCVCMYKRVYADRLR